MKPRALDLFCGAGGATRGLQLAGFHVTGVDINPQRRYCGDDFRQADALEFPLDGVELIWASPPCQGYSSMRHLPCIKHRPHIKLIEQVRTRLAASGAAWVIENVVGAPLRDPLLLCGTMFPHLRVYRHRLFETSFFVLQPGHAPHRFRVSSGRNFRRKELNEGGFMSLQMSKKPRGWTARARASIGSEARDLVRADAEPR